MAGPFGGLFPVVFGGCSGGFSCGDQVVFGRFSVFFELSDVYWSLLVLRPCQRSELELVEGFCFPSLRHRRCKKKLTHPRVCMFETVSILVDLLASHSSHYIQIPKPLGNLKGFPGHKHPQRFSGRWKILTISSGALQVFIGFLWSLGCPRRSAQRRLPCPRRQSSWADSVALAFEGGLKI